jgi:hypothetical protein
MQYTADVGEAFVRASELEDYEGASVHNLDGPVVSMPELIGMLGDASITCGEDPLPFPSGVDGSSFVELIGGSVMRSIDDGVADSLERFRELLAEGRVKAPTGHRDGA